MVKKKVPALLLSAVMLMAVIMSGCNGSPAATPTPSPTPASPAAVSPESSGEPSATPEVTPSADAKKIKIGYDIYFAGNTWSVQLYKEFQSAVKKYSDRLDDVIYVESEGKVDKQIANLEDLITRGVDVIVTTPNSPTALVPVLTKAQSKGIKVVLLAAKVDGDCYDALVTVDDVAFGRVGAQWLADKLGGKGNVIALNGIAGISVSDDRWKGAEEVFAKYPDIKVVASANAAWDYAKAKTEVSTMLAAYPQIDGVWSQGGAMTLAAMEEFQTAGRKLVPMTSEDSNGFLKAWKNLQPEGFSSIACSKPTWLSEEALTLAIDLADGKTVTRDNYVDVPVITDDTLDEFVQPDLSDSFWANTHMSKDEIKEIFPQ